MWRRRPRTPPRMPFSQAPPGGSLISVSQGTKLEVGPDTRFAYNNTATPASFISEGGVTEYTCDADGGCELVTNAITLPDGTCQCQKNGLGGNSMARSARARERLARRVCGCVGV